MSEPEINWAISKTAKNLDEAINIFDTHMQAGHIRQNAGVLWGLIERGRKNQPHPAPARILERVMTTIEQMGLIATSKVDAQRPFRSFLCAITEATDPSSSPADIRIGANVGRRLVHWLHKRESPFALNTLNCRGLITSLARGGLVEDAYAMLGYMDKHQIASYAQTYSTLLSACGEKSNAELGERVHEHAQQRRVQLNVKYWNAYMSMVVNNANLTASDKNTKVQHAVEEMKRSGIKADKVSNCIVSIDRFVGNICMSNEIGVDEARHLANTYRGH